MTRDGYEKTLEEILKERAEVLGRTGTALQEVLEKLEKLDSSIKYKLEIFRSMTDERKQAHDRSLIDVINEEIGLYNATRKQAQVRYYYLIVTREALGLRKHKWAEEIYRIPPRKKTLTLSNIIKAEEPKVDG